MSSGAFQMPSVLCASSLKKTSGYFMEDSGMVRPTELVWHTGVFNSGSRSLAKPARARRSSKQNRHTAHTERLLQIVTCTQSTTACQSTPGNTSSFCDNSADLIDLCPSPYIGNPIQRQGGGLGNMNWMQVLSFTFHLSAKLKAFHSLRGKIQLKSQLS